MSTVPSFNTVHVVGLGAIGTLMAMGFAKAGIDVHIYDGDRRADATLQVFYGDHIDTVRVRKHTSDLPELGDGDAVVLAIKWPSLRNTLSRLIPRLTRNNFLLLPQNGLVCFELPWLTRQLQVVPVVVHVAARAVRRGFVAAHMRPRFLLPRFFKVSEYSRLEREGFSFLDAPQFSVQQRLKVLVACTSAPMALRGVSIGEAFSRPELRSELVTVACEASTVLLAYSQGNLLLKEEVHLLLKHLADGSLVDLSAMRSAYTSLHEDLNVRHSQTETDWLNGLVVRLGQQFGIPTPVNQAVVARVRALERRRRCFLQS